MFSTDARCPICRSAKVRKPRRLVQGVLHRECYCGACGIRFRLPVLYCLFKVLSLAPAPAEGAPKHSPQVNPQTVTPAFISRTAYQRCLERTPLASANSQHHISAEPLKTGSPGLHFFWGGKTFHVNIQLGHAKGYPGSLSGADISLGRIQEIIRARWRWINDKTNPH